MDDVDDKGGNIRGKSGRRNWSTFQYLLLLTHDVCNRVISRKSHSSVRLLSIIKSFLKNRIQLLKSSFSRISLDLMRKRLTNLSNKSRCKITRADALIRMRKQTVKFLKYNRVILW